MEFRAATPGVETAGPTRAGLRRVRWWQVRRTAHRVFVLGLLAGMVTLTIAAAIGRIAVLPSPGARTGVHLSDSTLIVTEPVPVRALQRGDVVVARPSGNHRRVGAYEIAGVDAWTHVTYARAPHGVESLRMGAHADRVVLRVPYVGAPYGFLVGIGQAWTLLALSGLLLVWAYLLRRRAEHRMRPPMYRVVARGARRAGLVVAELLHIVPLQRAVDRRGELAQERLVRRLQREVARAAAPPPRPSLRSRLASRWWWARVAAIVVWSCGVMSLTASAVFQGTQSPSTTITSATASISLSASGFGTSLTGAFTGMAPGDLIERPVDVTVSAGTTTAVLTNLKLTVSVSPSTVLDTDATNGLQFWIQMCSGSGWTEGGSAPGYTYSCNNTKSDILGSSLPAPPGTAGTCPPAGATVSSLNALKSGINMTTSPANPLVPNTTYHLVVFACLPTAAGDSFQDVSSTLTFTFNGVQRSGTQK